MDIRQFVRDVVQVTFDRIEAQQLLVCAVEMPGQFTDMGLDQADALDIGAGRDGIEDVRDMAFNLLDALTDIEKALVGPDFCQ